MRLLYGFLRRSRVLQKRTALQEQGGHYYRISVSESFSAAITAIASITSIAVAGEIIPAVFGIKTLVVPDITAVVFVPASVIIVILVPAPVVPVIAAIAPHFPDIDMAKTVDGDHDIAPVQAEGGEVDQPFADEEAPAHFINFHRVTVSVEIVQADVHVAAEIAFAIDNDLEIAEASDGDDRSAIGRKHGGCQQKSCKECKHLFHSCNVFI